MFQEGWTPHGQGSMPIRLQGQAALSILHIYTYNIYTHVQMHMHVKARLRYRDLLRWFLYKTLEAEYKIISKSGLM